MSYTETSLDVIRLSRVDKNPPVKRLKLISVGSKDAAVWALTGSSCLSLGVVVCLWASAALFPVTLENISDPLSSATFLSRVLWARAALATLGQLVRFLLGKITLRSSFFIVLLLTAFHCERLKELECLPSLVLFLTFKNPSNCSEFNLPHQN